MNDSGQTMTRRGHLWIALVLACAGISGCLLNSVQRISTAPASMPDNAHAIVVLGIGLDAAWPYAGFPVTLAEYSAKKQQITGNCFRYNRIEAQVPSIPAKIKYFAYEVPANIYVYLPHTKAALAPASDAAFIAPPGGTVYFGDYVFVGDTVAFRRDLDAARIGARALLPRGATLTAAETATAANARMFICTP